MIKPIAVIGLSLLGGTIGFAAAHDEGGRATDAVPRLSEELLVFSKTAGFRHQSNDVAVPAIVRYAEERGVTVVATEDASYFTDEKLARFGAVVFVNTTGLLRATTDERQPGLDLEQQAAFERYIRNGGGYVGIHAASDVNVSRSAQGVQPWEWYNQLVGATFRRHPQIQEARLIVENREHPSTRMLGTEWLKVDEWYDFHQVPDHVNVLLRLDTESYEGSTHQSHPIAWYHEYDGGRAFFTGLGHTDESFTREPLFMQHLWGGIRWAMGFEEVPAGEGGSVAARDRVVVTREQKFNYMTWRIEAGGGTWHFEIESAVPNASPQHAEAGIPSTGFSSAIDRAGNDWIANDCQRNTEAEGTGSREWRGWPNFAADGFGHPCRGGSGRSRWVTATGAPIEFTGRLEGEHLILESWNDSFRLRYHFFPSHAAIEVLQADSLHAFLFEGPIAGQMNILMQRYVLQDGVHRMVPHSPETCGGRCLGHLDPAFGRNFPSPFFYFVDPEAEQIIYFGVTGQSEGGDEGWAQPRNMVIFSFGRENDRHALSGTGAVSVFGFLDKSLGHQAVRDFIHARLESPFVAASAP
jgi:type 1 glutamine amidotransferase